MDGFEALFAVVIICINHNEWDFDCFPRRKHGLAGSPRFCTIFRKFSRNIVDILKCVVHSYIMRRANRVNAISNDLFELLLDILTDDKYHMIET